MLRREDRDVREVELLRRSGDGIADTEDARIEKTDDVARVGVFNDRSVLRHELLRLGKRDLLSRTHVVNGHALFEFAGADTHKGHSVSVVRVHVRLDLKYKTGEEVFCRLDNAFGCLVALRARSDLEELFQERLDTEVRDRGSEEYRCQFACEDLFEIKRIAGHIEKLDIVLQRLIVMLVQDASEGLFIVDTGTDGLDHGSTVVFCFVVEKKDLFGFADIYALEITVGTDRPVDRGRADAEDLFELVDEIERILGGTVHLVDEGEDRNTTLSTDREELDGLRLDTFRAVEEHDRGVGRAKRTVSILGEVLVTRGIEDIDAVAVIVELHNGRGNGNTTLLLDLHPVGCRVMRGFSGLNGTGHVNGASVEKELLGHGRLTGVRVRDDRKRAAALYLILNILVHMLLPSWFGSGCKIRYNSSGVSKRRPI